MEENVYYWIATAPLGAASVLAEELKEFGAEDIRERSHDVRFQGSLALGYRVCLWSRTATRVYLSLGSMEATSSATIYEAVKRMDWRAHFRPGATLACDCSGGNEAIRHTLYGSQLLKDAVCDSLRESTGSRPDIRPERPDVLLHLHVEGPLAWVSLDFSGESLHQRGYRVGAGRAPLKENVAAAVLLRAGWPKVSEAGGYLLDPMCGSGTFLCEAALIASHTAPALSRDYFGFLGWRGHDEALWLKLKREAESKRVAGGGRRFIVGSDIDSESVALSLANAEKAGVASFIHVERRAVSEVNAPAARGLMVVNPPYGERLGEESELPLLYEQLGALMRERLTGWTGAVLTGNPPLARHLGIYAKRAHRMMNGAIDCRLLRFDLGEQNVPKSPEVARAGWAQREGAKMFANRLRKNLKRLEGWAAKSHIDCYRLYDADMPEYAFAIDLYATPERHVYVQEYAAPKSVNEADARERRREVLAVLPDVLEAPLENIHTRVRKVQKGSEQYDKRGEGHERFVVQEGGLKFLVNFRDYLDTGLFLDHRVVRARLREWAKDADFLNLFCYTGSATVYAAAGGAKRTVSVDLSNTYIDWAIDNLKLNGFGSERHHLHREDCLAWLAAQEGEGAKFDLIFLDPPTFSNSKRMEGVLDVQRDHVAMLRRCLKLLRPEGRVVFSTNHSRFKLDQAALADLSVEDISAATMPKDFERNARIHRCFVVRFR
ncbi:MAG TPA: bifunctional 23S rRNA (guanine(2069)-N(7))-methyltransferase RlmK/23S rRNA (guanine(2445)-N(2))-methyltransferase RlmL [Steroidobacteraceae bacterium]|jgi:23S rRNA (guanine2445-N2)-methyltransferase / 23S rRNA (guanine2069-N7)-methyltransferase